ncbi:MAG: CatB-related O-acetyltransferase [Bacteroidales bacterium]|nr:CatB-related O-acetyltransferase [Bacteroidales bacterium]
MIQLLWKLYLRLKYRNCKLRGASFARNVKFEDHVTVEYGSHIGASFIGRYTYINKYCMVDKNVKKIGRFCSIAYGAKLGLGGHPTNWVSSHPFTYDKKYNFVENSIDFEESEEKKDNKTIIGNDVWIGANAIVLAGVKIGNGAIIGANSLVNKNIEPYSIVFGNPAVHKRYRFDKETCSNLHELKWWNFPINRLRKNIQYFNNPQLLFDKAMNGDI